MTQLDNVDQKEQNEHSNEEECAFTAVNRVANYPTVSKVVETAKGYYYAAKEASPTTQFVGDKLEATVQGGYSWIAPKVEPVLQNETVQKYAKKVDNTLNKGLDTFESKVEHLKDVRNSFEEKVDSLKNSISEKTYTAIEGADNYLKESVVGKPITAALNVTEKYLPSDDKDQPVQGDQEYQEGPILQAARISKKLQRQALAKLKDLSLRSPDHVSAMQYTVDLIQYAATSLDTGVTAIGGKLQEGAKYAYEAPKQLSKDAADKLIVTVHDAADALNTAIQNLSKQLPEPVATRVEHTVQVLKSTAENVKLKAEGVDLTLFYNIANKGNEALHSVTNSLSSYVSKGEEVPAQLLHTATTSISDVLDNLIGYLNKHTTTRDESPKAEITEQTH